MAGVGETVPSPPPLFILSIDSFASISTVRSTTPITSSASFGEKIGRLADELPPQPPHLTPPRSSIGSLLLSAFLAPSSNLHPQRVTVMAMLLGASSRLSSRSDPSAAAALLRSELIRSISTPSGFSERSATSYLRPVRIRCETTPPPPPPSFPSFSLGSAAAAAASDEISFSLKQEPPLSFPPHLHLSRIRPARLRCPPPLRSLPVPRSK